jgi:hypothetical protein
LAYFTIKYLRLAEASSKYLIAKSTQNFARYKFLWHFATVPCSNHKLVEKNKQKLLFPGIHVYLGSYELL